MKIKRYHIVLTGLLALPLYAQRKSHLVVVPLSMHHQKALVHEGHEHQDAIAAVIAAAQVADDMRAPRQGGSGSSMSTYPVGGSSSVINLLDLQCLIHQLETQVADCCADLTQEIRECCVTLTTLVDDLEDTLDASIQEAITQASNASALAAAVLMQATQNGDDIADLEALLCQKIDDGFYGTFTITTSILGCVNEIKELGI